MNIIAISEVHQITVTKTVINPLYSFNERLRKDVEIKSNRLQEKEAKRNRTSNYRKNFSKMTQKPLSTHIGIQFDVLEEEFGFNSVRNMVEYMRVSKPGVIWNVNSFFNYLLKALQGRREQLANTKPNSEDTYIKELTNTKRDNLKELKRENKLWV